MKIHTIILIIIVIFLLSLRIVDVFTNSSKIEQEPSSELRYIMKLIDTFTLPSIIEKRPDSNFDNQTYKFENLFQQELETPGKVDLFNSQDNRHKYIVSTNQQPVTITGTHTPAELVIWGSPRRDGSLVSVYFSKFTMPIGFNNSLEEMCFNNEYCYIKVKIDDGPIKKIKVVARDLSNQKNILDIDDEVFLNDLKKAITIEIRLFFYDHGIFSFNFNI